MKQWVTQKPHTDTKKVGFEFCWTEKESIGCQVLEVVFLSDHWFLGRNSSGQNSRAMFMQTDQILSW